MIQDTTEEVKIEESKKSKSNNDLLREKFYNEHQLWLDKIANFSKLFSDIRNLKQLQTEIYLERQILLEKKFHLLGLKYRLQNKIRLAKKNIFYRLKTKSDLLLKYNNEILIMLEAEISEEIEKLELLEMQIDFYSETIKSIDLLIYGLKNRIMLEEF